MLSGSSWGEFILVLIIGLLILGPERLPRVASQLGRWVGKARRTANQLRFQLEREIAMADIEKAARGERESKPNQADDSAEAPQPSATDAGESAGEGDGAAAEADVPTEAKNDEPKS